MLIKLILIYFLLSGIAMDLLMLNLDNYYEHWCRKHKDASMSECRHLKDTIEDLKSDLVLSMLIAFFFGWLLVPLASLNTIKNIIQKLL